MKANLLRQGIDLAFETDLLYLDVTNQRIGIKTATPTHELQVVGTTRTTELEVDNSVQLGSFTFGSDTITNTLGDITFGSPLIINNGLQLESIDIYDNIIETTVSNADLEIRTSGTGKVHIQSDARVDGNLHVTGNITADGNIGIGDSATDTVTFNAEIASDLIPDQNETYTIGQDVNAGGKRWNDMWVNAIYADSINSANIVIDGINLATRPGNTYYVSEVNGNDTYSGTHPQDPVRTVAYALSQATAGDTVYIYTGTYEEAFPLTVPVGVTVKGFGIRSVTIKPTAATRNNNAFQLNGESTVEDISITDFEYDSINDKGYAFVFASNFTVTSRSPYIRNVSVLTKGSTVRLGTNPPEDPLGFDAGDAGRGAKIDGSLANASSREASMLFHSATFICPAADTIVALNGTRVEWLNSFIYYANRGLYLQSGTAGFAGDGKTKVKITSTSGTFAVNDTLTYYDVDGVTALAQGTIESIDGDFYIIDGKVTGFESLENRTGKVSTAFGDAQLDTAQQKFGTASLLLDGTGDYVKYTTQPDFGFGTGDFTVETFVRLTDLVGTQQVFDFRNGAVADIASTVYVSNGGQIRYYTDSADRITGSTLSSGTWYHVALCRESGSTKLFVDGTQVGSTYTDSNDYGTSKPLTIGSRYDGGNELGGHFDEFRISNVARYTSNFVAPSTAFLGDLNSVLLLHFNGLDGATDIIDDGITTQDIRTSSGGTATAINFADYSDFGVEVRSIGSANVYGNYGAYGDGDGVTAYLIGHNLAYIGSGKSSENDPSNVIQANEITELNRARIYYSTVDHKGDFRIGDNFYVNQATGEVTFSNSDISVTGSLTLTDGGNTTIVDATKLETGNIRLSGNTISSTSGDINIDPFSNQLNLNSDVTVTGDLNVNNDATIGGNLILVGDIVLSAAIDSDLIPNADDTFNIGSPTSAWKEVFASRLYLENLDLDNNKIRTLDSNSNLELEAAGSGSIQFNSPIVSTQDLTVQGSTTLLNTTINGNLTQTGDQTITGSVVQTGNLQVDGQFSAGDLRLDAIDIIGNRITTTQSNADLELYANGTGRVIIPETVEIGQDLWMNGGITTNSVVAEATIQAGTFVTNTGGVLIQGNLITSPSSNDDLILNATGTGHIILDTTTVDIVEDLNVQGTTTLSTTDITGTLNVTGDVTQTGDINQTGSLTVSENIELGGYLQLDNIKIDTNFVTTTESNSDLELRAAGTGKVLVPNNDVQIDNDLNVLGSVVTSNLSVTGSITAPAFDNGNILVQDNFITTTDSNSDLELRANGTGEILVPNNNVQIDNDLTVSGITDLQDTNITGTITHTGNLLQTGNTNQTGNFNLTGDFASTGYVDLPDLLIETNYITTKTSNSDLELRASGTGRVIVPNNDVEFGQNLTVIGDITASDINITGTLSAPVISNGNIEIDNNVIRTTDSNSDLELQANGAGVVRISDDFVVDGEFTTTNLVTTTTSTFDGTVNISGTVNHTADYNLTGNLNILSGGILDVDGEANIDDINITTNKIRTVTSNSDLEISASGTGRVIIPNNDVVINQNLTIGGNLFAEGLTVDQDLEADVLNNGDIEINGNVITTTLSNSNLELRAAGTGIVLVPDNDVQINNDLEVQGTTTLNDVDVTGTIVQTGNTTQTGDFDTSGDLTVNGDLLVDGTAEFAQIRIQGNTITSQVTNGDLILDAIGVGQVLIPSNILRVNESIVGDADADIKGAVISPQINTSVFNTGNLRIQGNLIESLNNNPIQLRANGSGHIAIESIEINETTIATQNNDNLVLQPQGTGHVDIDSVTSLILPSGTTLQRPAGETGMIRFNSDYSGFEGYDGTQWRRLDGVYDLDRDTYITCELNPGDNDSIIRFYVNGVVVATLDSGDFQAPKVTVDDLELDGNTISTVTTNQDIVFAPSGTGSTRIGNFAFKGNTITNTVIDSVTVFAQTGANGYFKIDGTNGFVIPVGQDSERGALAELGMIRFNTTDNRVEIYNGTTWISVAGAGGGVTITEAEDLSIRNALIFG